MRSAPAPTVSSLGEDETYFWRVRAANATGKSPWSNTRRFFISLATSLNTETLIPETFRIHANYPNPFNAGTTFRFDLPERTFVKLIVYDVLGQITATILSETMNAGHKQAHWRPNSIASGVYFFRLQAGNYSGVGKLLLLQ